ncbi:hypothetical protein [Fusibacter tunisiensis]|uniref:Membrane protein implicated in regulation of membrane protease activity n=1 Tax=Fusibacter tunisiensis TaxID=1008308 RepID=A0ABS2MS26_9FIRM|nr:hypothetical protein [Fusibacter tunisiensis]MBM7562223.1 membrane protein implicated in regulation of membrane protease activity [Fusibacter tunisiensis]
MGNFQLTPKGVLFIMGLLILCGVSTGILTLAFKTLWLAGLSLVLSCLALVAIVHVYRRFQA